MMIDRKVNLDFKESGCFMKIENLVTEQQNPATMKIDQLKTKELLQLINQEDQRWRKQSQRNSILLLKRLI
jgi:hypothetical protein